MSTLLIYHYHFRPGGVRSVIERGLVEWCLAGSWPRVVILTGEPPAEDWVSALAVRLPGVSLEVRLDSALGYLSELRIQSDMRATVQRSVQSLVEEIQPDLIWAHNLSLGRNPFVGLALAHASEHRKIPLLCHDHDWWPQHRWQRWQEMVAWGLDSLDLAAAATFPLGPLVRHAVVRPQDAAVLGPAGRWIANPMPQPKEFFVNPAETARARQLLGDQPFWLVPARVLRRKNLLEAVLLMKLLRPDVSSLLVAGPTSVAEENYGRMAVAAAANLGLTMTLGVAESLRLSVPAIMQQAAMVLQTSVQEGFGLTTLEASAQAKPLILRRLPMITSWLESQGGNFPHTYNQLRLPEAAIPRGEETQWRDQWQQTRCPLLPAPWRQLAETSGTPDFGHFSGLSLPGQTAVLAQFTRWESSLRVLNPFLEAWSGTLQQPATAPCCPADWPQQMNSLWDAPPAAEGSSLRHLELLFHAHLSEAGAWPILW